MEISNMGGDHNKHDERIERRPAEFVREQRAVAATEYAILLALLVLGSMSLIMSIGQSFRGLYLAIAGALP
jgi:Flp pilus assembly pilin Flp